MLACMAKKLRIGVLGTGNIARQFAAGVRRSYRCEITAVGSRSLDSASVFAEAHGIRTAHPTYDALLADRNVDAVYISGPNSIHHEWTIRALRAGKHVLCEKPFAMDAAQAEEMFDVSLSAGKVVMEAFMYLCHPQTHAVIEAIQRGTIGKLNLIRTNFCYATSKIAGNVRFDKSLGGGALMDVGCYCISLARLLCDAEPTNIHAFARMHTSGVDELTTVAMEFPGKVMSHFSCAMLTHADNAAHISGSDGWLEIPWPWKPSPDRSGYVVSSGIAPRQDATTALKQVGKTPPASSPRQSVSIPVDGDLFGIEADEFAAAVLDGTSPRVSREFTLGNMRVLDEVRRQIGLMW